MNVEMVQFKRILIPTDFSPAAWNAINMAIDMCCGEKASITLLHVYPSSAKFDNRTKSLDSELNSDLKGLEQRMTTFSRELSKGKDLEIDSVILSGWVDEEILSFIQKNDFDLVIMGINSNGLDNRPGSHITQMIEKTSTPLMVIPNNQTKTAFTIK
ncbi:MAG: universal stress protein [Cyclobacteriaceae bacterium]